MASAPTRKRIFDLTGESNYKASLTRVSAGDRVSLIAEPDNQFDPRAVYVVTGSGEKIGYLAREDAAVLQPALSRMHAAKIHQLTGGMNDYPHIGCRISVAWDGAPPHPHKPLDAQQKADGRFSGKGGGGGAPPGILKALLRMLIKPGK